MEDESWGGIGALVVVGVVVWIAFFGGWTQIKQWTGQNVYEDQRKSLDDFVKRGKIGTSGDVWLVKQNLGEDDRVALFFGYLDDFGACWEFMQAHSHEFPTDVYACQAANI